MNRLELNFSQNSHGPLRAVFARCTLLALLLSGSMSAARADGDDALLQLSSGSLQTPLIELYTSEGCSSCPPADRWLQRLGAEEELWSRYVPVAFHVTYWNYLGWRDRFSQPAFDERQRALAQRAGSGVYTPGVFLQGREWRNWRRPGSGAAHLTEQRPVTGVLQAKVGCQQSQVQFAVDPAAKQSPTHVEIAWLQSSQHSDVSRGENRGRRLEHDFVVASHRRLPLSRDAQGTRLTANVVGACDRGAEPQAVAVWVTDAAGSPLQAVGGHLPAGFVSGGR